MKPTIAQKRSEFALNQITNIKCNKEDFGKLAAGIPAMILQNGFGQTLAFLLQKGTGDGNRFNKDDKYLDMFDMITRWLAEQKYLNKQDVLNNTVVHRLNVVKSLSIMTQSNYLKCQEESLKFIDWIKRYANSGLF